MINKLAKATDTFKELAIIYISVILVFAVAFHFAEAKSFIDSIWWAFVTAMTVGYGDVYPVTFIGRALGVVLMHIVPLFIVPLIVVRLTSKIIDDKNAFTNEEQEEIKRDIKKIKKLVKSAPYRGKKHE